MNKSIIIAISHSFCANFIRGQAGYLSENGYKVYIVSADGPEVRKVATEEKVELIVVDFAREIAPWQDLVCLFKLLRIIRKIKPDIVNAGNPKSGLLFMIACKLFKNTRSIFTLRGLRSDTLVGVKRSIVVFMERLTCWLSEKIIVISPSLRDHAISTNILEEKKSVVLGSGSSNGVNLSIFSPSEIIEKQAKEFRAELGIKPKDFVIGFAGRLTKDKGIVELFQGYKLIKDNYPNLKLVLTGPIEYDDPISDEVMTEMQNDPNVFMPGKSAFIASVLFSYDVLVLFSHREGFGNVALEASAMERPIIVSDIPGCRDTVENNLTGFIAAPRDPVGLAEKLSMYIENEQLRISHGKNGRKRVIEKFQSTIIWEEQLKLYNSFAQ